ncbi:putative leucine-rich repeat receptor-like protein kinase, partial [Dichanthelium oligosanthes]
LLILLLLLSICAANGLNGILANWKTNTLSNWIGNDPCGAQWSGIICAGNRVTSIRLSSFGLAGTLSGDIQSLSELTYLYANYSIRICRFGFIFIEDFKCFLSLEGLILQQGLDWFSTCSHWILESLAGCSFTGEIPKELGQLSKLLFLSLNSNKFSGQIPPALGALSNLYWFDLADNKLTGELPVFDGINPGLDNLTNTKHFHFGINQLRGSIPSQIFSSRMKLIHLLLDNNNFSGSIPPTLGLLKTLEVLRIDNNHLLTGPVPSNINNLTKLGELHLANSKLTGPLPDLTGMISLSFVYLENLGISGQLPQPLFSLLALQTLRLRGNNFNGTLTIGSDFSTQLQLIDLQDNQISAITYGATQYANQLIGTLLFRSPSFSDLTNSTNYVKMEQTMRDKFIEFGAPVDSISIHDQSFDVNNNLRMSLDVFPSGKTQFVQQDISNIAFVLSNQTYKPPPQFGPFVFLGQQYSFANDVLVQPKSSKKTNNLPLIIGVSAGGAVLVAILLALIIFIARRKRTPKRTDDRSQSFVSWDMKSTSASTIPQLRGARVFSFDELRKITNNFSEANDIGNGGYGKVYRGTMPSGQLVAVKRSQQGSLQGSLEFRTEIELLSRVHHKNVVSLVGFCLDQDEQILVYEYVPNGTLKESLTGKSGVRLDWRRRLRVVLGAAKGIAYLHELADPPIVHRDIKSSNVLLDDRLNAKGYLDPEYYMTQQLTEKSDVYSFGVLMLEVVTAKKPLERGRYIVREVKAALDRSKDLYGLHELLDPALGAAPSALAGLEQYVDLALRCVEEAGADRPSMGEAVGEIERMAKMAGGPGPESASNSMSYASRTPRHPYGGDSPFDYSGGGMPSTRVEPK